MNKTTLTFSIILLTLLINLSKSNAHTKIHNNYIYFTDDAHYIDFNITSHCVSPKQPFEMPNKVDSKDIYYTRINVRAGRHSSVDTVKCVFTNMLGNMLINNKPSWSFGNKFTFINKTPSRLNFAIKGTLTINDKHFDDIILAQGHAGAFNNWWFGGNQCERFRRLDKEEVTCTARDKTQWCFTRGKTGDVSRNRPNHVKVKMKACS